MLLGLLLVIVLVAAAAVAIVSLRDRDGDDAPVPIDGPLPAAGDQDPSQQAAMLLRLLLTGSITVERAEAMWPQGELSVPDARTWLDYFREGIWGPEGRDPAVDRAVEAVATDLTHGRARSEPTGSLPPLPGWVGAIPIERPDPEARDANALVGRLVACLVLSERAAAETAPRDKGERVLATCRLIASQLGAERCLSDAERTILSSGLGDLRPDVRLTAHWRAECVPVLAWAVGMLDDVPSPDRRFEPGELRIEPTSQAAVRRMLAEATLRTPDEQAAMKTRLADERRKTAKALKGHEQDPTFAHPNSRALERYRAIAWVTGYWPTFEQTPTHPDA